MSHLGVLIHKGFSYYVCFSGKRCHSNIISVFCEQQLVGFSGLMLGYSVWADIMQNTEERRTFKKFRYLCEVYTISVGIEEYFDLLWKFI